jgi:hypothetical protein
MGKVGNGKQFNLDSKNLRLGRGLTQINNEMACGFRLKKK